MYFGTVVVCAKIQTFIKGDKDMKRALLLLLPLIPILASCGVYFQYPQQYADGIYGAGVQAVEPVRTYSKADFAAMAAQNIREKDDSLGKPIVQASNVTVNVYEGSNADAFLAGIAVAGVSNFVFNGFWNGWWYPYNRFWYNDWWYWDRWRYYDPWWPGYRPWDPWWPGYRPWGPYRPYDPWYYHHHHYYRPLPSRPRSYGRNTSGIRYTTPSVRSGSSIRGAGGGVSRSSSVPYSSGTSCSSGTKSGSGSYSGTRGGGNNSGSTRGGSYSGGTSTRSGSGYSGGSTRSGSYSGGSSRSSSGSSSYSRGSSYSSGSSRSYGGGSSYSGGSSRSYGGGGGYSGGGSRGGGGYSGGGSRGGRH